MSQPSLPATGCLTAEMNRQLSLSLASALAAESRGSAVNTAKLRSVSQLDSYDAFKSMVAGAHLKGMSLAQQPLDSIVAASSRAAAKETGAPHATADSRRAAAQLGAPGRREEQLSRQRSEQLLEETRRKAAHQQPQNAYELKRDWKRLGMDPERAEEERFRYLMSLDVQSLPSVMKGGVGLEALGEMLQVVNARRREQQQQGQSAFDGQARAVFRLLFSLSTVARFQISVAFLSQQQRQDARDICSWLMAVALAEQLQSRKEEEESTREEKEQMLSAAPPRCSPAVATSTRAEEAACDCDGVQLLLRRYKLQAD